MEPIDLIKSSEQPTITTHPTDTLLSLRGPGREIVRVGADKTVTIVPDATMKELREVIMLMAPMAAEMVRR